MSEETATPAAPADTDQSPAATPDTGDSRDWKAEAEKWQALARKHEDRAKANSTAATELDKFRKAQMTETERAVAEAKTAGRNEAFVQAGQRLARAELRATAAGRVEKDALDGFLAYADMSKFLGDDGEPDVKAIETAIKALAGPQRAPDFDGGARSTAGKTTDMNALIRQRAGLG